MSKAITLPEQYNVFKGEVEIEVRDRSGRVVHRHRDHNLIKIFAKELLSHRLPFSKVWDPTAGSGSGDWVDSNIDILEEFAAKYILFGASFDNNGLPLDTTDSRYYSIDSITGGPIANTPDVGADHNGDLINPIPISDPDRPLKKIERVYFQPSYQPADTPLVQSDVRAINNVLVLETTLQLNEYNGFGNTSSDFFTITEVGLAGGKPLGGAYGDVGACNCDPHILLLEGVGGFNDQQIIATANAGPSITIDPTVDAADVSRIKEGDQILIVARNVGTTEIYDTLTQVNPYYLATSKAASGRDVVLDRTPVDAAGTPLSGPVAIYRSTLRLFSQRILSVPFKKSDSYQIKVSWRIAFN